MSNPVFLHIYADGKLFVSNTTQFTPVDANTLVGTFRFNSDASSQLLTTLSGTVSSNLAIAGTAANGKYGREVV